MTYDPQVSSAAWPTSTEDLSQGVAVAAIKPTANMTAIVAHTASSAVPGVFGDLAAAQAAVDDLRTDLEAALDEVDARDTTLRAEAEARLDAIETKIDALTASLRTAGIIAT